MLVEKVSIQMDTATLGLLAYFALWVALGLICSVRCRATSESRIVFTPISLVIRVAKGLGFLDRIAGNRTVRLLFLVGIILLAYSAFQYYSITISFIILRFLSPEKGGVAPFAPLLPGVTISIETFLLLLPGLSIAIIVHELAHAVAAKAEGLRVKSAGFVVFLAFVFGAFVEVDEEELKKARLVSKLSVYSAGVAANIVLAFILLHGVLTPLATSNTGLIIVDVVDNSTAARAGLRPFDIIVGVNGTRVESFQDLSRVLEEGAQKAYNQTYVFTVLRDNSYVNITLHRLDEKKIGVLIGPISLSLVELMGTRNAYYFYQLLFYAFMINYVIAIINAAPIFITDGARAVDAVFERVAGKRGMIISRSIQVATLLLLLANMNLGVTG